MDYTLDVGAVAVSIIALAISIGGMCFNYYEKRITAKKAVLVPEFVRQTTHMWRPDTPLINDLMTLQINNFGQGIARDVKILVDYKELTVLINGSSEPDAIPYIAPGAHFSIAYSGAVDQGVNHNVTATWKDDNKADNRIVSTVSFV